MPNTDHYDGLRAWSMGDTKLDWHGAESGQGSFEGHTAGGSPTVWTTNDQSNTDAYHALNRFAYMPKAYNRFFTQTSIRVSVQNDDFL